nr:S8 family serine peptidase [uncultured Carboxylicivirga sp.]
MIISTYLKSLVCFCFISIITVSVAGQQPTVYKNGVLQSEFKVKLKREVSLSSAGLKSTQANGYSTVGLTGVDKLNFQFEAISFERLFPYSAKFNARHQKHGLHLWYKVRIQADADIADVLRAYADVAEIEYAEPFYQRSLMPYNISEVTDEVVKNIRSTKSASPFDDPRFDEQWHYHNTEDNPGIPGADINLLRAWERETGHPDVIVAVIDQGVDYLHEDLADNMWINEAELNGTPGEDSDGNGYIDDIYGFNFVNMTGKIERLDHGTHVAGTVAATNNNGIGVSGVAGGSGNGDGVRIMSCMIMSENASGDAAAAFVYAADNGAIIAQNSWGYNQPDVYEQSELDAIDYFIAEAGQFSGSPMKGGVVIFATGNMADEGNYWPGCYEHVISVAATDPYNHLSNYSNYGEWVTVSAPGGEVTKGSEYGVLSTMPNNSYGFYDGTSMACPHVSGIAALVASQYRGGDFDNEQLIARLIGGTIPLDTIEFNKGYEGKMGIGGVDAYLALQKDNGIPPNPITDLVSEGTSSNFARLKWTVPVDEDDDEPRYFHIYYHTIPFDTATINNAERKRVGSSLRAGEEFVYDLNGLERNTTYYIAVSGVDRWGNEAELSDLISVSTNNGPIIELDKELIEFGIDVRSDSASHQSFTMFNKGDGILKWNIVPRHIKNVDTYNTTPFKSNYQFHNNGTRSGVVKTQSVNEGSITPFEQVPSENYIYYFDVDVMETSMIRLGDQERTSPNSTATYFKVTDEEGFNLTGAEIGVYFENIPTDSMHIEVYQGHDITTAKLLHSQVYYVQHDGVTFEEVFFLKQMHFNQGDGFFIVYHIGPGYQYPVLASDAEDTSTSDYCYFSTDFGNTWKVLKDVYDDELKVFNVIAISALEPLGEYIKLSESSGLLAAGESKEIDLTVNGHELINGEYDAQLQIFGEGYDEYWKNVDLDFKVDGHTYKLESDDLLEFGNVFIGEYSTESIVIHNVGLGAFDNGGAIDISISNEEFTLIGEMTSTIQAQRAFKIDLRYTPVKEGPSNATVTLTEKNGGTYKFTLFGVASKPAKAVLSPTYKEYSELDLDTIVRDHFYLRNDGDYPLRYYVPKFADGSNMPDYDGGMIHRFGYAGGRIEPEIGEDFAFEWNDISTSGKEITDAFRLDGSVVYKEALIGFAFPYFGNTYDTCYITNQGAIALSNNGWFNAKPAGYNNPTQSHKLISAWGMPFDLNIGGQIFYQSYPDKFVLQYEGVVHGSYIWDTNSNSGIGWLDEPITFQIILHQDGDIDFLYKDLGGVINDERIGFNRSTTLIMIEDQTIEDALVLNGFGTEEDEPRIYNIVPTTGHKIYFKNPGYGVVTSLTNPYGLVQVGDSIRLDYEFDTDGLYVGDFEENINVITNDPINTTLSYSIKMDIESGGEVNYTSNVDEVNFGDVFQGGVYDYKLTIGNDGKAIGFLTSVTTKNELFEVSGYMPVALRPNMYSDYIVSVNAKDLGELNDVVVFTDTLGNKFELDVKCNVIYAPEIGSGKDRIEETLSFGETKTVQVSISNSGLSDMEVSPSGNEWMNVLPAGQDSYPEGFDYAYTVEYDADHLYNPSDVIISGEKLEMPEDPFDEEAYWVGVPLPYPVNYYGVDADTLFIGQNGVITTIGGQDAMINGPDYYIPNENGLQGFLAPVFGFNGLSNPEDYPLTGVYCKGYEDKFVVRFQDIASFGGGKPISTEIWMFRNGLIKFMYEIDDPSTVHLLLESTLIGIENHDGKKGIQVSARTNGVIKDKTIVTFIPKETYTVKSNGSMDFDVYLNARSIYGGEYQDQIVFENNTPDNPSFSIPVDFRVLGIDNIVIEDTLDLGDVYIVDYDGEDYQSPYKRYEYEFTISNEGSRALFIRNLAMQNGFATYSIMGDDDKFGNGNSEDGWIDISRSRINHTLYPNEKEVFMLRVTPLEQGIIADTLLIICDTEEGEIRLPVDAHFTMPPRINIHSEGLHVYANTANETDSKQFTISNDGPVDLEYHMEFVLYRQQVENNFLAQTYSQGYSAYNAGAALQVNNSIDYSSAAFDDSDIDWDDFNNILEHENDETSTSAVGFGGSYEFYAATAFEAPSTGFNLSHVMVWYAWGEILESDIQVIIRGGSDDFYKTEVLAVTDYKHTAETASSKGEYVTIELDQSTFFFPYEKFYVMFKFSEDVTFPLGTAQVQTSRLDRFYFGDGQTFYDAVSQGYGTMAWMMKAAEMELGDAVWASSDDEKVGELSPGAEQSFTVNFNSVYAGQGVNTGAVVFRTNDPYTERAELPISLTRNKGPQYEDGSEVNFTIDEMEVLEYTFRAYDEEGDNFTLSLKEEVKYLTCEIDGDQVSIVFEPDYDGAGNYDVVISGIDSWGNQTECTINITVNNVNRAPVEEIIIGTQKFDLQNEDGYVIQLTDYIIDPDGDDIEFDVNYSNPEVMDVFQTGETVVFIPQALGYSEVSIEATDEHGATLETAFDVFVEYRVGIDDNWESTIRMYPNPVQDVLYLDYQGINAERYDIIDASGSVLKNGNLLHGSHEQISVTNLMSGIYILKIYTDQGVAIKKFTKQ